MEYAIDDAWAVLDVEGPVGNPGGAGKGGINAGAVGAQNRFLIDQRPERRDHVCGIEFFQFEVGSLPAAIAHHEHRNLLGAEAALAGHATPVTGWPGQTPLAFEGFEKEGFVRLDDPRLVFGPVSGRIVQETMAPSKRGVLVDLATAGGLAKTDALNQEIRIARPLFALAQMRQCRCPSRR